MFFYFFFWGYCHIVNGVGHKTIIVLAGGFPFFGASFTSFLIDAYGFMMTVAKTNLCIGGGTKTINIFQVDNNNNISFNSSVIFYFV